MITLPMDDPKPTPMWIAGPPQPDVYAAFRGTFTLDREASLDFLLWGESWFVAKLNDKHLAEGPTRAHAATKAIVRAQVEGGARAADERVPELAGGLFGTEDLQGAVRSFLERGPGHATYRGR